jgi:hypothetical protein
VPGIGVPAAEENDMAKELRILERNINSGAYTDWGYNSLVLAKIVQASDPSLTDAEVSKSIGNGARVYTGYSWFQAREVEASRGWERSNTPVIRVTRRDPPSKRKDLAASHGQYQGKKVAAPPVRYVVEIDGHFGEAWVERYTPSRTQRGLRVTWDANLQGYNSQSFFYVRQQDESTGELIARSLGEDYNDLMFSEERLANAAVERAQDRVQKASADLAKANEALTMALDSREGAE